MRPDNDIQYLKGVGPKKAALYAKLGVHSLLDLLYHFPRSYIELGSFQQVSALPTDRPAAFVATVLRKYPEARIRKNLSLFKVLVGDESGPITLSLFNGKFLASSLTLGEDYVFYGQPAQDGRTMATPMVFRLQEVVPMMPVYPLTAGITSREISRAVRITLEGIGDYLPEPMPPEILEAQGLLPLPLALRGIHLPNDQEQATKARERLIFEELFALSLAFGLLRNAAPTCTAQKIPPFSLDEFYHTLPFSPTGAQRRATAEILLDMSGTRPMSRLLQGDVGSGKTLVAAAACLSAVRGGFQCAVMAPTEILATQHFATFQRLLEGFSVRVSLLTGSTKKKERTALLEQLAAGEIDVLIGTHALLEAEVSFSSLGLVITDEQHRFGVTQRVILGDKGATPHVLVMSATPIPRTLALIIYGDLDISVLDELPAGRQEIDTYCIPYKKLPRALSFVREQLDAGQQGYIVCPLVSPEESGDLGLPSAEETAAELSRDVFSSYRVEVLHGKLPSKQKEAVMGRFQARECQLLIATTVIEVGVDVPDATCMLILGAERFGLSQLHQLRGRVGRGLHKSYCILVSDAKGEVARERLRALCQTRDGFVLSELDLRLRGPGDFFGGRQHGLPELSIADLSENTQTLTLARTAADALLAQDPTLSDPRHRLLLEKARRLIRSVGERPN